MGKSDGRQRGTSVAAYGEISMAAVRRTSCQTPEYAQDAHRSSRLLPSRRLSESRRPRTASLATRPKGAATPVVGPDRSRESRPKARRVDGRSEARNLTSEDRGRSSRGGL